MKRINLKDVEWTGRFAHQKAILFTEDDLNSKGSKVQVIKIQPDCVIEPHFHKIRTEIFVVLKGKGTITLGDEHIQSKENDFFLCQPNTVHAFKNNSTVDFIVAVIRTNDTGDTDMLWLKDQS